MPDVREKDAETKGDTMTIEVQAPEPIKITSEYLDYLIGILTGTVTPKAAAEFIPVLEIARAAQLGTAWAEAMEQLSEDRWRIILDGGRDWARATTRLGRAPGPDAVGATPAAALRSLAEKLRTP